MDRWTFIVATPGVFVAKFARSIDVLGGAEVNLTAEGSGHLTLEVCVDQDLPDAIPAQQLAERIVNRLSFELDVALDVPCPPYYDLTASIVGDFPMDSLLKCLDSSNWGAESPEFLAGCGLYREGVSARDPIAGFVIMWNLLVMLTNSERAADAAVERYSPEIEIRQSRKRGRCTAVLDAKDDISHLVHRSAHCPAPSAAVLRRTLDQVSPYLRKAVRAELCATKQSAPVEQAQQRTTSALD